MPHFDTIKKLIDEEVSNKKLSVSDKLEYSTAISKITSIFSEFTQMTSFFMHENNITSSFNPIIYFDKIDNDTRIPNVLSDDNQISVWPTLSFTYFALREYLQNMSHNSDQEYLFKIAFNKQCTRHYNKIDLILNFDYYDEYSSNLLPKTTSKYSQCPEKININAAVANIFDSYIKDYIEHIKNFLFHNKFFYDMEFIPLSCKMYAIYDYSELANQDFIYSEESHILAYEVCMNIFIFINSEFE